MQWHQDPNQPFNFLIEHADSQTYCIAPDGNRHRVAEAFLEYRGKALAAGEQQFSVIQSGSSIATYFRVDHSGRACFIRDVFCSKA